jgi:ABC-type transport system involved in multi-copper enzyme maturation permease subunit
MIVTQSVAMLVDAYRELNHKKLFWITMILSGLFMGLFALLGVSENGFSFAGFHLGGGGGDISAASVYKSAFDYIGIGFWLTWAATILALISTAFIFPDFITAGSIDLYLTKPIGRLRLFLTKYMAGLMFVALQVTAFCTVSFFVMGIRAGLWIPSIFLGIPIVTLFFSYLFSIQVLFGVWTRSTIAALLITVLCWTGFKVIHWAESSLLQVTVMMNASAREAPVRLRALDERIARLEQANGTAASGPATAPSSSTSELDNLRNWRTQLVSRKEANETILPKLELAHKILYGVKTVIPKTSDTVELLSRCIITTDELTAQRAGRSRPPGPPEDEFGPGSDPFGREGAKAAASAARDRPLWWVIGTSLLFEAAVVTLAAWIFCRRDY